MILLNVVLFLRCLCPCLRSSCPRAGLAPLLPSMHFVPCCSSVVPVHRGFLPRSHILYPAIPICTQNVRRWAQRCARGEARGCFRSWMIIRCRSAFVTLKPFVSILLASAARPRQKLCLEFLVVLCEIRFCANDLDSCFFDSLCIIKSMQFFKTFITVSLCMKSRRSEEDAKKAAQVSREANSTAEIAEKQAKVCSTFLEYGYSRICCLCRPFHSVILIQSTLDITHGRSCGTKLKVIQYIFTCVGFV